MDILTANARANRVLLFAGGFCGVGHAYCFVAIERHSKLVLNIAPGKRDQSTIDIFLERLRGALCRAGYFQITTEGFPPYKSISTTLGDRADYAMLTGRLAYDDS